MKVLLALLVAVSPYAATIRGTVLDATGGAIERAAVRVLNAESREVVGRSVSQPDGAFSQHIERDGDYLLVFVAPGFRQRVLPVVVQGEIINLGSVRLGLGGCDSPGTMCDSVCAQGDDCSPPKVRKAKDLDIRPGCAVDVDRLTVSCNRADGKADIRFVVSGREVWLEALKRGQVAPLLEPVGACGETTTRIRLDGLGPGAHYCLTTGRGTRWRLYVKDEIAQNPESVPMRVVEQP